MTPLERAVKSLDNQKFIKLICGASNTDKKQIQRLATIYSLCGVDVIDISPDKNIYESAKEGIKIAQEIFESNSNEYPQFNSPVIMLSINTGNDLHFRKVELDSALCTNCLACTTICPAKAILEDKNNIKFNQNSCYGCGRCIDLCYNNALKLQLNNNINQYMPDDMKAVELHTGNNTIREIKDFITQNPFILQVPELISFSVEASLFNKNDLINYVNSLISLIDKKVIIQLDGKPMGANNKASSTLQTIAAAQLLDINNSSYYLQLAGGTNHITKKYVKDFDLKISGIGYGTFARKIILPYIVGLDDSEFISNIKKCVNITTNLVGNYGI